MTRLTRNRLAAFSGFLVWTCATCVAVLGYVNARRAGIEQRALIEHLEEQSKVIAALFVSDNHGMVIIDHEGKVIEWNPFLEKLTGIPKAQLVGHTLEGVMEPQAWEKHGTGYRRLMKVKNVDKLTINLNCTVGLPGKRIPVNIVARIVIPAHNKLPYAIALVNPTARVITASVTPTDLANLQNP